MSKDQSIIRMANDIAANLHSYGESEAVAGIAEHINKFWAPPMRKRFFELVQDEPESFDMYVVKAVDKVKCSTYNPVRVEFKDKTGTGG